MSFHVTSHCGLVIARPEVAIPLGDAHAVGDPGSEFHLCLHLHCMSNPLTSPLCRKGGSLT